MEVCKLREVFKLIKKIIFWNAFAKKQVDNFSLVSAEHKSKYVFKLVHKLDNLEFYVRIWKINKVATVVKFSKIRSNF